MAGTAIICIAAAFGAAFLVARAVNHDTPARAATPPVKATHVAATPTAPTAPHKVNVELVSQFAPLKASLKPKPKPKPKHKKAKPKPAVSITPAPSTTTTTPPTYTAPVYSAPPPPAPTHSTHHKHSGGSSGGSGTTTIGG
ncbi:MAG: hypothetical protein ACRDPM_00105 [Solirubrobacteraceae bacterium]